jgi:hypothetical protein
MGRFEKDWIKGAGKQNYFPEKLWSIPLQGDFWECI